jgi:hypothetical protein
MGPRRFLRHPVFAKLPDLRQHLQEQFQPAFETRRPHESWLVFTPREYNCTARCVEALRLQESIETKVRQFMAGIFLTPREMGTKDPECVQ